MRVHLIGVSGAGMAPLAGLLHEAGHEVSGSDAAYDPPMGPLLPAWGVTTRPGLAEGPDAPELVVVGNVCRKDHPLVLEAERRGIRRVSMPTALRELVARERPVVAVCGTHGKTTTTALLAHLLAGGGLEPGSLIGGVPLVPEGARPFALGRAQRSLSASTPLAPFVVEGDEYDSAFFEKVPKVWGYAPRVAILTSIEHDHVDIYPDEESYLAAFRGMIERLPDGGLLVANAADPLVVRVVREAKTAARVVWYAASDVAGRPFPSGRVDLDEPAVWTASEVGLVGDGDVLQPFDLFVGPSSAGRFGVGVFGPHNVGNALAAIAVASEAFQLPVRETATRASAFRGVKRRLERRAAEQGVVLYDDFAHHPTAVDATLRAVRARHRAARLVAVYEPRSATACRAMHQEAYTAAFGPADVVVLPPLGRSTIPEAERLDLDRLARDLEAKGKTVVRVGSVAEVPAAVVAAVAPRGKDGAVVLVMSNGAFGGVVDRLETLLSHGEVSR